MATLFLYVCMSVSSHALTFGGTTDMLLMILRGTLLSSACVAYLERQARNPYMYKYTKTEHESLRAALHHKRPVVF